MDPAFLVYYKPDGDVAGILILHVDDIMVATDGSSEVQSKVNNFHNKYPFGEWTHVAKAQGGVTYTGRCIKIVGNEIHIGQQHRVWPVVQYLTTLLLQRMT